ncbi:MAG: SGNH/GDSL hydrolase family protein [Proteobacteria bacterium]|nr:SGNH/GDSL hydrolase family protein [Pseudomonadota bacterium]
MTKYPLLLSLIVILFGVAGLGAISANRDNNAVRILFIGNSLTSANNLPAMVAAIADSRGVEVITDAHTPGGARLRNHAANKNVLRKLRKQSWDFVVLQEQSQSPGFNDWQLARDVFPHATRLVEESKKVNPDTSVIFYMTMAHRNGDPANQRVSSELLTYEGTQRRINGTYLMMARDNQALVAPVGEAWRIVREERPDIALYADNTHPNPTGTYLAACVFYATLFQSPCTGAAVPRQVNQQIAEFLQKTADDVVLTSGNRWDWRE